MTIDEAFVAHLKGFAGLASVIGARIYSDVFKQNIVYPAVKYQRVDTPRERSHQGNSHLSHPRFQFSAYAQTTETANGHATAKAVADQIRAAFDAYIAARLAGTASLMGGASGVDVQDMEIADERSDYEPDTLLYRADVDVIFWHAES